MALLPGPNSMNAPRLGASRTKTSSFGSSHAKAQRPSNAAPLPKQQQQTKCINFLAKNEKKSKTSLASSVLPRLKEQREPGKDGERGFATAALCPGEQARASGFNTWVPIRTHAQAMQEQDKRPSMRRTAAQHAPKVRRKKNRTLGSESRVPSLSPPSPPIHPPLRRFHYEGSPL